MSTTHATPARRRRVAAKTTAVAALVLTGLSACSSAADTSPATEDTASGAAASQSATQDSSTNTESDTATTATDATTDAATGTYSATGSYRSPGGQQEVAVSVTLEAGVITAVEVTPQASDATSQAFQEDFAANVADQVVGKTLDEAQVSKVSGSSLTSQGFNAAIDAIAAELSA